MTQKYYLVVKHECNYVTTYMILRNVIWMNKAYCRRLHSMIPKPNYKKTKRYIIRDTFTCDIRKTYKKQLIWFTGTPWIVSFL